MTTVYISDLDGTLLNPSAELSEANRRGIQTLLERGVLFTVASARGLFSMRAILGDLPFRLPVISFNGGYVSNYSTGEHLIVHGVPDPVVRQIQSCMEERGLHPFVSTHSGEDDRLYVGRELNSAMAWFFDERVRENDTRLRQVDDVTIAYDEVVTCISVMGARDKLEDLLDVLCRSLGPKIRPHLFENMYAPGAYWLTIHAAQATKANGIRSMLEGLNLMHAKTVVFGDHHNDLDMFKMADVSIAMENAVDELKEIASHVIGSNEGESVVAEIYRLDTMDEF